MKRVIGWVIALLFFAAIAVGVYWFLIMKDGDITKIKPTKEYKIVYDLDGGQNDERNVNIYKAGTVVQLYPAKKDDHVFLGWFDENGEKIEKIEGKSEDIHIRAVFSVLAAEVDLVEFQKWSEFIEITRTETVYSGETKNIKVKLLRETDLTEDQLVRYNTSVFPSAVAGYEIKSENETFVGAVNAGEYSLTVNILLKEHYRYNFENTGIPVTFKIRKKTIAPTFVSVSDFEIGRELILPVVDSPTMNYIMEIKNLGADIWTVWYKNGVWLMSEPYVGEYNIRLRIEETANINEYIGDSFLFNVFPENHYLRLTLNNAQDLYGYLDSVNWEIPIAEFSNGSCIKSGFKLIDGQTNIYNRNIYVLSKRRGFVEYGACYGILCHDFLLKFHRDDMPHFNSSVKTEDFVPDTYMEIGDFADGEEATDIDFLYYGSDDVDNSCTIFKFKNSGLNATVSHILSGCDYIDLRNPHKPYDSVYIWVEKDGE